MLKNGNAPLPGKGVFGNTARSNYTSNLDLLLNQLRKVKSTGRGHFIAICPSHDDKNPSLTIRSTDDGKILL